MKLNHLKNLNSLRIYYINFLQYIFYIIILFSTIENLRMPILTFNIFTKKIKLYYILCTIAR